MNEKEIIIPPFVQDYIDKVEGNGLSDFVKISAELQKEKDEYPGKYALQSAHLKDFNKSTGQNHKLNYEEGLQRIDVRYRQRAYHVAKQHGFNGPDPTLPSDKEFTKQGEKFLSMIDHVKHRQEQPMAQQQNDQNLEKKNMEVLKGQEAYQQNQTKVEFISIEQEQPFDTNQQSLEQRRAAFLDKIQKTRESQAQPQQDKQPER